MKKKFLNPFTYVKELMEMRKAGGLKLCKSCLEKITKKVSPDKDAFEKSVKSGKYKETDGKCYICNKQAKYIVDYNFAIKSISKIK